jgi:aminopeptidase N
MNNITLLVDNLDVKNWTLWTSVENPMKYDEGTFADTILDNVTDKWTIKLHKELPSQSILEINFLGYMTDKMSGFYRSYYYENGMKVWLGTTQFQQTDSRKAFPSFDEPGFKSTYRLKIDHPVDYNCISNTKPEATPTPADDGRVVTTFKMTPPMSSYLLAFIVSKYDRQKNNVDNYGVVARPDAVKANATFLALDFGQKMIDAFGKALGIDYYSMKGIEKMDTAAIPDFSAGAMENWGLLTYRETLSLYYPDDTPSLNEQRVS